MAQIGLGGSCYWCMEAIFRSLDGVQHVTQGWLAGKEDETLSEGVLVDYDEQVIDLFTLLQIHLHTHSSTSDHALRGKYRSAVYVFNSGQRSEASRCLSALQSEFDRPLVTLVLDYLLFKPSPPQNQDYYYADPQKPFCRSRIAPKLNKLLRQFGDRVAEDKRLLIQGYGGRDGVSVMAEKQQYTVEHDFDKHEYRMQVAPDEYALVTYRQEGNVLHLTYSEVPASMRGHGIGSALMENVLAQIQSEGHQVLPVCGFIKNYISTHEKWHSLLAD